MLLAYTQQSFSANYTVETRTGQLIFIIARLVLHLRVVAVCSTIYTAAVPRHAVLQNFAHM